MTPTSRLKVAIRLSKHLLYQFYLLIADVGFVIPAKGIVAKSAIGGLRRPAPIIAYWLLNNPNGYTDKTSNPIGAGLLTMTEDTFLCHCEATEGGRGNLKRTDLSSATDPKAGIQFLLFDIMCNSFGKFQLGLV